MADLPAPNFSGLPDEVVQQIFFLISPHDTLHNVLYVSRRFNSLSASPLLWRYFCRIDYKSWDSKHRINHKFRGPVGDVDWKRLYLYRRYVDEKTTGLLNGILESQTSHISKYDQISAFGYDAKETLLRHCAAPEEAEDVLARRYYASAVLDHLHRGIALAEWFKLGQGQDVALERALGSFDLFVLHGHSGDLYEIGDMLDQLVIRFRAEHTEFDELTTRCKTLVIAAFLRAHNLTGIESDLYYRDLQNNYIGVALRDEKHPSLPLISAAIFCAIGVRLGLDARCSGMPSHIHAMVYPSPGESLDSIPVEEGEDDGGPMYLDPFRSDVEVPSQHLKEILSSWGVHQLEFSRFTSHMSAANLVIRTSRNILTTVQEFRLQGANATHNGHPTIRLYGNPFTDLDNAFYSALWSNFILSAPITRTDGNNQLHIVPLLLERFEHSYPEDCSLVEKYIMPLFNNPFDDQHRGLHETLRIVRAVDQSPKQRKPRDTGAAKDRVKYKVGQIFRHKRYGYLAVITGWDIECGMNYDWIYHNQVDSLSRGRHQSFYNALVEDSSIRYVAEESIEILEDEYPESLMALAGQYFKRWDDQKKVFVSNIRDEYPED